MQTAEGRQPFENYPELANILKWFAANVGVPGSKWQELTSQINALASLKGAGGLRWVKSSERLPDPKYSFGEDEFGCFPVRWQFEYRTVLGIGYLDTSNNHSIFNAHTGTLLCVSELEWLEETESPSTPIIEGEGWIDKQKAIDVLRDFYEVGNALGYSNAELSRISSCIEKIKAIKQSSDSAWTELDEWKANTPEEIECCLWCKVPITEPPYSGTLLDDKFPGLQHFTHYRKLPNSFFPQ